MTNARAEIAAFEVKTGRELWHGDLFIAESGPGHVRLLRDSDADGKPEENEVFASGLRQPFGIAFYPGGANPEYVYVANTDSVVRFPYENGELKASAPSSARSRPSRTSS